MDYSIFIESEIDGTKESVWNHVTQMKNVNAELGPYIWMTYPKDRAHLAGHAVVPMKTTLFTSILLLFGWIPFDLHFLSFDNIVQGKENAFYENSTTLLNRYWKHTRKVYDLSGKTYVSDEVHFCPRVPFIGNLIVPVVRFLFQHRHANLRKSFSK